MKWVVLVLLAIDLFALQVVWSEYAAVRATHLRVVLRTVPPEVLPALVAYKENGERIVPFRQDRDLLVLAKLRNTDLHRQTPLIRTLERELASQGAASMLAICDSVDCARNARDQFQMPVASALQVPFGRALAAQAASNGLQIIVVDKARRVVGKYNAEEHEAIREIVQLVGELAHVAPSL